MRLLIEAHRAGLARLVVGAVAAAATLAGPRATAAGLIYVNRCASSCTVSGGPDDAVNGTSSVISGTANLSAFEHGDIVFNDTVSCLRSVFAHYDVEVTTTNPGVARREVMLAGNATQAGYPPGSGGVAPAGSIKGNAIGFVFANDFAADPDSLCWSAALQLGALYALDIEYYCPDLMSFSSGCGLKTFTNVDAPCGFNSPMTCPTSGLSTQNSAALLEIRAGPGDRVFLDEFETARPAP
jgi:hypothetical protein